MNNELGILINVLSASLEALRTTLPANTEAVLHDLTRPEASVIDIVNGHVSGRKKGDALLSGPNEDEAFLGLIDKPQHLSHHVFSGYTTITAAGKKLHSSSTLYYDYNGCPLVAFCVNVDTDIVTRLKRELDYLVPDPVVLIEQENNINSLSEQSIDELLSRFRATGSESNKEFRMRVVAEVYAMGLFKIKGSVNHIAKALGVTRYTIYNYLDKLNEK
ncbi:helix-turn-helix transcriptional regulator [Xenorhabdus thuongxuanensis]|uniref:Transcriptional regulator DauR n=1 Tax=Xenorhabdus thuongxuanensis TaxID=1873484 RepID=A0A1Q5TU35_9GAMM|nr:PAS domain-containing protein [Xenorhabdus thuongxuanensis]OKP03737.1 Transcriptional regulator DauR [Xenorhabdus thuongxuanensis]